MNELTRIFNQAVKRVDGFNGANIKINRIKKLHTQAKKMPGFSEEQFKEMI